MITRREAMAALERRKPVVLGTILDDWRIVASYIDQQDAKLCDHKELVPAITRAVRKADDAFEKSGGSSRHWVRDCFLDALENEGLCVVESI